jgi:hypothetical protein
MAALLETVAGPAPHARRSQAALLTRIGGLQRRGGAAGANRALPTLADYPIILRGSKGPVRERTPAGLAALACRQGWAHACAGR